MATDLAVEAAGNFLLQMSQPYEEKKGVGASVLTPEALQELQAEDAKGTHKNELEMAPVKETEPKPEAPAKRLRIEAPKA
eukprot:symbB.v1.2.003112.t1/scaffold151.1/size297192/11